MAARLTGLALAPALASPLAAATLPDPTAPPAMADAAAGTQAAAAAPLTAIRAQGRQRLAVIGGQEVAVGGRYQDARVVRIGETEVVLRRGAETMVLKLHPEAEKQPRKQ